MSDIEISENRDFKGVWIPKEIWLNTNLSIMEKVLLVEIDSLDAGEAGCYASNGHFSKFFGMSESRISELITSLKDKGYIRVSLVRGNQGFKRNIYVNRTSEGRIPHFDMSKPALRNIEVRTSENTDIGNTLLGNTLLGNTDEGLKHTPPADAGKRKKKNDAPSEVFEQAWLIYPKRDGANPKATAWSAWKARVKAGVPEAELLAGTKRFKAYCEANRMIGTRFICMASVFYGTQERFREDYRINGVAQVSTDRSADRALADRELAARGIDVSKMTDEDINSAF